MSTGTVSRLRGTPYQQITTPTKDAGQMAWRNQVQQGLIPGTSAALRGLTGMATGDENYLSQLEAPAYRNFGQLQSQIASRFSGMGTGGRHSSGFQNAESGAATDFAERLQSQRVNLMRDAWRELMGMGQHLYDSDTFDTHFLPKKKSFWEELFGNAAQGAGMLGGLYGF